MGNGGTVVKAEVGKIGPAGQICWTLLPLSLPQLSPASTQPGWLWKLLAPPTVENAAGTSRRVGEEGVTS